MLSAPSDGPIVRSSMMSIGAASEPARSSSARSLAASVEYEPVIWKLEPSSDWIVATVSTSPLPFSNSTMPIGLPMFSRETSRSTRPPWASSLMLTDGRWFWSKPADALSMRSPVKITCFFSTTGAPLPCRNSSLPNGIGSPWRGLRGASGSTRRASSVAVRPMMSLALAVSCTPGSCTTMRSAPCCWITGSATPSSLTRLCSVVMFCFTAASCTARRATSVKVPTTLLPSIAKVRSGMVSASTPRARLASSALLKRTVTRSPLRSTPPWRMPLSRSTVRASPARLSSFLSTAPFMSTCSRKCTPPRRSRPRYIGSACSDVSHFGEPDSRFSATT